MQGAFGNKVKNCWNMLNIISKIRKMAKNGKNIDLRLKNHGDVV